MKRKKCIRKVLILTLMIILFLQITLFAKEINQEEFSDITAPNMMIVETNTGKILYQKNIDEKIYPASITKLMTAILVVENCELDEIVTISENAVISVPSGYVNANLQVGEELTVEDLLYVMLIPSANDAANALAEHVAGSIESFSTMMNTKAKELGCTGSNFTNPSGLHEKEHYTTARDISFIAREAISNEVIRKVVGTTNYTLPQTNKYNKSNRTFTTTNYMKRQSLKNYYRDYCIGGKTGYTGDAKNCVVEFASKDEIDLIVIVMGEDAAVKGKKFIDARKLLDYSYENYENKSVAKANEVYETIKISNATKETKNLEVIYKDDINILEAKEIELNTLEKQVNYNIQKAPIKKGDVIGTIKCNYEGIEYETQLVANADVEVSNTFRNILYGVFILLAIYIIYNYKKSNKKGLKSRKKKYKKVRKLYY